MVGRARELKIEALLPAERVYLLGLFLADGCADITNVGGDYRGYRIRFFLQWNEKEIGRNLVNLLRRTGLNAHFGTTQSRVDRMVTVITYSKSLYNFLPDAKALVRDSTAREKFLAENRLFEVENGVSFLGGLLDGDGRCEASFKRGYGLRSTYRKWSFTQTKYLFLIDYVKILLESLAENSVKVGPASNGGKRVQFRESGVRILLDAGIAEHSWKVRRWLKKIAEIEFKIKRFCTVGEAAKMLGVSRALVLSWVKTRRLRHLRRSKKSAGKAKSIKGWVWYYIPTNEVERRRDEIIEGKKETERIKKDGLRLLDAAKELSVSPNTLRGWYRRGELRATLVHELNWQGRGYLVIPREEIERLKKRTSLTDG